MNKDLDAEQEATMLLMRLQGAMEQHNAALRDISEFITRRGEELSSRTLLEILDIAAALPK